MQIHPTHLTLYFFIPILSKYHLSYYYYFFKSLSTSLSSYPTLSVSLPSLYFTHPLPFAFAFAFAFTTTHKATKPSYFTHPLDPLVSSCKTKGSRILSLALPLEDVEFPSRPNGLKWVGFWGLHLHAYALRPWKQRRGERPTRVQMSIKNLKKYILCSWVGNPLWVIIFWIYYAYFN